jgi:hypothetical protein
MRRPRPRRLATWPDTAAGTAKRGIGEEVAERALEEHGRHGWHGDDESREQQADAALLHGDAVQAFGAASEKLVHDLGALHRFVDLDRQIP